MSKGHPEQQPHPSDAALAVSTHNLHVAYESNVILHGVDVDIPVGQCVAITGANGSGKSTFVKALMGSAPVTAGDVELLGGSSRKNAKRGRPIDWRRIGYVPQRPATGAGVSSSSLEVVRSGTLGPKQWWHPVGSKKRAQEALKTVGLLHRQDVPLQVLSGGQQQRVRIARALVRDPDLLIMDEPLAGIDHHSQNKLAEIVGRLKDAGKTIILILHELGPLEPHLDRAIHIANGHVEFDGDPKDLPGVHAENHHHYPHPADMPSEDRFMGGQID
ncbi:MAG TPA: metal ABC transporter ATP-binding protein [Actinomyces sp.]|nr:metal ABC transporter ATP-binding protein [Acidobacteriota bacterium]HHT41564.1 metal ABC transporter ATP-binding protein [Actinomyces sp.]